MVLFLLLSTGVHVVGPFAYNNSPISNSFLQPATDRVNTPVPARGYFSNAFVARSIMVMRAFYLEPCFVFGMLITLENTYLFSIAIVTANINASQGRSPNVNTWAGRQPGSVQGLLFQNFVCRFM